MANYRSGEAAPLGGEAADQRGRLQGLVARAFGIKGQSVADVSQPQLIGIVHWPGAPHRPAIAIDPDHIDVAGARRDALFENARTLVDHWENHALDDLL